MNPEATNELIWHFAGYLHIADDYAGSRLQYGEIQYQGRMADHAFQAAPEDLPVADLPELKSNSIRVNYSPKYDHFDYSVQIDLEVPEIDAPSVTVMPNVVFTTSGLPSGSAGGVIDQVREKIEGQLRTEQTPDGPGPVRDPVYTINYVNDDGGKVISTVQQNLASNRDYYSDAGEEYSALHHVPTGDAIPDMLDAAGDFIPDVGQAGGAGLGFWTDVVRTHDEAVASGEIKGETLTPGRYVNGELQEEDSAAPEIGGHTPPAPPERSEGDTEPGLVAELGANKSQNVAVIADVNEAPSTLIVMGDYYKTDAIFQANVLQDDDRGLGTGPFPVDLHAGDNQTDNIADFAVQQLAAQGISPQKIGDLQINVDYIDGDLADIKSLTQRNFIDDGDVSVQTQYNAYSQVMTGGNAQQNVALFEDWGKHYDIIIVLGDYHSANIISQTNILLDNDVVGIGSGEGGYYGASSDGSGSEGSVYTGQNTLQNEASITRYGETTFSGLTGDIEELISALGSRDTLDRESWSSFHGAASGSLNVLFVTGDYYDLNMISQINVISDADLAVQLGSPGSMQWLSVGGNTALNSAEIIDAGGLYKQHLGGSLYEDSLLVQANMVSESSYLEHTQPTALVPELVAFLDPAQESSNPDGETWTTSTYSNQDSFGNVLS